MKIILAVVVNIVRCSYYYCTVLYSTVLYSVLYCTITGSPGAPTTTGVNKEIVAFAKTVLQGGKYGMCKKSVSKVENFKTQVNSIVLYCTILYYTILYCTILYYTVLYYTVLYCSTVGTILISVLSPESRQ